MYNSCASSSSNSHLAEELLEQVPDPVSDVTDPPLIPFCLKWLLPTSFCPSPRRKAGAHGLVFPEVHKAQRFDNLHPTSEACRTAGDPQKSPLRDTTFTIDGKITCSKYFPFSSGYRGSLMETKHPPQQFCLAGNKQGMQSGGKEQLGLVYICETISH